MPDQVCFVVPGEPVSKGRPRLAKGGHSYTPPRTREAEKRVSDAYRLHIGPTPTGQQMVHGRLAVEIVFVCKNRRKRDVDNMAKLVLDALNGVAYVDDDQIDHLFVQRVWTQVEPETRVLIWKVSD